MSNFAFLSALVNVICFYQNWCTNSLDVTKKVTRSAKLWIQGRKRKKSVKATPSKAVPFTCLTSLMPRFFNAISVYAHKSLSGLQWRWWLNNTVSPCTLCAYCREHSIKLPVYSSISLQPIPWSCTYIAAAGTLYSSQTPACTLQNWEDNAFAITQHSTYWFGRGIWNEITHPYFWVLLCKMNTNAHSLHQIIFWIEQSCCC